MANYKDFEERVFKWLMSKREKDPHFTFSLRQIANKGAETDYFIGTEKSKYFGTTFWIIPVYFPGSSSDLIDLNFIIKNDCFLYSFQFNQTRSPQDEQNRFALEFLQQVKVVLKKDNINFTENMAWHKMEWFQVGSIKGNFSNVDDLLYDLEINLDNVLQVIEKELNIFLIKNPSFNAHRINESEFQEMFEKLQSRRAKFLVEKNVQTVISNDQPIKSINMHPLNLILYGPPGTGKTYNTINKAVAIIEEKDENVLKLESRNSLKRRYENYVKDGQIVFTTFHQSMSYEDFIEGIKPVEPKTENSNINYKVVDGIFKLICNTSQKTSTTTSFDAAYAQFIEDINEKSEIELYTPKLKKPFNVRINSSGNCISIPKTEIATQMVVTKKMLRDYIFEKIIIDWKPYTVSISDYFIENYFNIESKESLVDNKNKNFVLIIDEINRGNISQIFGELITLIEEDKRMNKEEALEVILPYSKDKFGVPPNIYIIGTMNTADRSVEALDAALRRRFCFEEMSSKPELLSPGYRYWDLLWKYVGISWENKDFLDKEKQMLDFFGASNKLWAERKGIWEKFKKEGKSESQVEAFSDIEFCGINLEDILKVINKRIEILLDKDHQIGHSYFMNVLNINQLKYAFQFKIIPLLQEYFFGDYGKIGLVLGEGFLNVEKLEDNIFASINTYDSSDFFKNEIYHLKNIFKMNDIEFQKALTSLLKKL